MIARNLSIRSSLLLLTACLGMSAFPQLPPGVQAQTSSKNQKIVYTPPTNLGTPRVSQGAVVRGNCNEGLCLIALMPGERFEVDHFPLTVSDRPTFFFNVPRINGRAAFYIDKLDSSLTKKTRVYKTIFPIKLDRDFSIVNVKLPQDAPALEANGVYLWEFSVTDLTYNERVSGLIRRVTVTPNFLNRLKGATPLERAALYAKNGIWFETVATLANSIQSQPHSSDLLRAWQELLKSVNLERVATQPLSGCCTVKKY